MNLHETLVVTKPHYHLLDNYPDYSGGIYDVYLFGNAILTSENSSQIQNTLRSLWQSKMAKIHKIPHLYIELYR